MASTLVHAVEIDVSGLGGHLCHVSANEEWSVSQLKEAIQEATGIFKCLQQLVFNQAELGDAQLLSTLLAGGSMPLERSLIHLTLLKRPPDYAEWLQKVKRSPLTALQNAPEHIRSDRNSVVAAVKVDGRALQFASEELKSDPEIVMLAQESYGSSFEFASAELRSSYNFVLSMVKRNGCALANASDELRGNR